ncbi:MAG: dihydropteroate synthase [Nitrososphaerota archaeon]
MLRGELAGVRLGDDFPPVVIGALNLSPESFYKGSVAHTPEEALERALLMQEQGAQIIDVGAASTAPYIASNVPPEQELERLLPSLRLLSSKLNVPLSVDTRRASVALEALRAGARIVNDTGGLKLDPEMARVVKDHGASLILMAYGPEARGRAPIEGVMLCLAQSLRLASQAGIELERVVVDPGIGFFRDTGLPWYRWDLEVLRSLPRLRGLGRPILVGISRKSFIGKVTGRERPEERLAGSLAAAALALWLGAHAVRAHDVKEHVDAAKLVWALREGARAYPPPSARPSSAAGWPAPGPRP